MIIKYKGHEYHRVNPLKLSYKKGQYHLDCTIGEDKYHSFECARIEAIGGKEVHEILIQRPLTDQMEFLPGNNTLVISIDAKDVVVAIYVQSN